MAEIERTERSKVNNVRAQARKTVAELNLELAAAQRESDGWKWAAEKQREANAHPWRLLLARARGKIRRIISPKVGK